MHKQLRVALAGFALVVAGTCCAQQPLSAGVEAKAAEIVGNFRRMIVLHEAAGRARDFTQAGQYLFFRNRELTSQLVADLLVPPQPDSDRRIAALLDLIETRKDWRDVDKLALLGVVNETRVRLPAAYPLAARLNKTRDEIVAIRAGYNSEITAAFTERPLAARKRPGWDAYVAFLHEQFPLARVMEDLKAQLPAPEQRATPSPKGAAIAEHAQRDEWNDGGLPDKTVLLTFDDGPHPRYTAEILRILDYYKVKAIFFQVGQNLGTLRDGQADFSRNASVVEAILRGGHAVANHTYTHPFLPKLNAAQVDDEIDTTQALLLAAVPAAVWRAQPAGARRDCGPRAALGDLEHRFARLGRPDPAIDRAARIRRGRARGPRHHTVPRYSRPHRAGAAARDRRVAEAGISLRALGRQRPEDRCGRIAASNSY
jgi:peptidoglycan/xylan/chitin deacetylase (PgdA/CDA1 family)